MKGTLHKSMNYGWMVQDGSDSFYPLHPYDIFTNSIERIEGKEVDFILQDFWDIGLDEKLIKVAIISAKIVDVPQQDEIQCNYCSKVVKNFMAIDVWMITDDNKNVCYECQMKNHIGYGEKNNLNKITDRELALFLRWLLKHYSTETTDDGFFYWADSMGIEVLPETIINDYKSE